MRKRGGFNQKEKGAMNNRDAARIKHKRCAAHRLDGRNEHLLVAIFRNESSQQHRCYQTYGTECGGSHTWCIGKDVYQQTHEKTATDINNAHRS